jgi:serine/threonine-protein kinase
VPEPAVGALFLGTYAVERARSPDAWDGRAPDGKPVLIQRLAATSDRVALGTLDHPSLARVHDGAATEGGWIAVIEVVEGIGLDERLAKGGMQVREAAPIMLSALAGLGHLHEHHLLHGHLQPGVIRLTGTGRAKLTGFGAVRPAASVEEGLCLAPEQLEGAPGDARSDLYAAAATFYQLLSGRHYLGETPPDLAELRRRVRDVPPRLPVGGQPGAISAWLGKGLAKNPAERFQSAGEMAKALQRAIAR